MGLQNFFRALKLSPKLRDLVLREETNILGGVKLVNTDSRRNGAFKINTDLNRKTDLLLFHIGKRSKPLSLEDRFSVRIFA